MVRGITKINFEQLANGLTNPDSLVFNFIGYENYFHDATEASGHPSAIVFAENEADVIAATKFCRQNDLPLVPRGAGTGLSGGCVPADGALVLSTEKLKNLYIDPDRKLAVVGPGVITKDLVVAAEKYGLTYPPDPASYEESTLGGNVAENAGGLRCKRFGVTRDYVIGLRAVTIDGEVLQTGEYYAGKGFNLGGVLIGSEGTLVIITEIALRLTLLPSRGVTILAAFDDPRHAAQTVSDITGAGIIPTVLEYIDGDAAACSNQYEKTDGLDKVAAILLIETSDGRSIKMTDTIKEFCERNRCSYLRVEDDPAKAEQLWKVRRNISKAVKDIATIRVSEDVAVPNSQFPVLVEFVAELNRTSPLRINSFGHAGDGNLHVNFLSMTGKEDDLKVMEHQIFQLLAKAVELGGTLSGEHGIGLAKRQYLPLEFDPPTFRFMKTVKEIFDPECRLNPGKIFKKS